MVDTAHGKPGGNCISDLAALDKDTLDMGTAKDETNNLGNEEDKYDVIKLAKRHIFKISMTLIYLITSAVLINQSYICISR